jgi:Tat protein translocase TatB subunit
MLRSMFGMGGTEILVILIVALLFLGPDKLPQAAKTISKGIRDIKKQSRVLQRTIEDDEHIGGAIRDLRSALRGEEEPYRPPTSPKELESTTAQTTEVVAVEPGPPQPDPMLGAGDPQPDSGDSAEGGHMPNSMRAFAETSGTIVSTADPSGAAGSAGTSGDASSATSSVASSATSSGSASGGSTSGGSTSGGSASSGSASSGSASSGSTSGGSASGGPTSGASAAPTLTFPPTAGQPDEDAPPPSAAEDAALASLVKPAPNTVAHTPRSVTEPSKSSGRKHG